MSGGQLFTVERMLFPSHFGSRVIDAIVQKQLAGDYGKQVQLMLNL